MIFKKPRKMTMISSNYISVLEFQYFFPQQIKCRDNYMKIHLASAISRLAGFWVALIHNSPPNDLLSKDPRFMYKLFKHV